MIPDRLCRVKSQGPEQEQHGFLVLVAHQSSSQKALYQQILKSYALLLERELRNKTPEAEHNFWPIVIHTGAKPWKFKTQRQRQEKALKKRNVSQKQIQKILRRIPDFEIDYLDLAVLGLKGLKKLVSKNTEVGCFLGFMGARRNLKHSEVILEDILERVDKNQISGRVTHLLASIELLARHSFPEKIAKNFRQKIRNNLNEDEEEDMTEKVKTWAEEIEEKILEEGRQEGRQEGLRESILGFVGRLFPEASETETQERLEALDNPTRLQFILNRVLDWSSYEDVWTLPENS